MPTVLEALSAPIDAQEQVYDQLVQWRDHQHSIAVVYGPAEVQAATAGQVRQLEVTLACMVGLDVPVGESIVRCDFCWSYVLEDKQTVERCMEHGTVCTDCYDGGARLSRIGCPD